MNHFLLKLTYHVAVMLDKIKLSGACVKVMTNLKDVSDENVSTLSYQYLGEIYLESKSYNDALLIYKECLDKLKGKAGDGFQCYGGVLTLAACAALELDEIGLLKEYINELKTAEGFEDWIIDRVERLEIEINRREIILE